MDSLFAATAPEEDFATAGDVARQASQALLAAVDLADAQDEDKTEVSDARQLFGEARTLLAESPGARRSAAIENAMPLPAGVLTERPSPPPVAPPKQQPLAASPLEPPAAKQQQQQQQQQPVAEPGLGSAMPTAAGLPPVLPPPAGQPTAPRSTFGPPAHLPPAPAALKTVVSPVEDARERAADPSAIPLLQDGPRTRVSASELAPMSVPSLSPPNAAPPPGPPSGGLAYTSGPDTTLISQAAVPIEPPSPTVSTQTPSIPLHRPARWPWALLALCIIGLGVWIWAQRAVPGSLVVTVAGPANQEVPGVRVFIDERLVCERSPCRVNTLSEGPHFVRAEAAGYVPTAKQAVNITSGYETVHNVSLAAKDSPARLRISARGEDLRVFLDGKDLGPPPVDIDEIAPGEYLIRVEGPEYEPIEERVILHAEEVRTVGPLMPQRLHATLFLEAGANAHGATVELDGNIVGSLPMNVRIDSPREHALVIRKDGFDVIRQTLTFKRGEAEKRVTIGLKARKEEKPPAEPAPAPTPPKPAVLNLTSNPPSTVLINGRPLGKTPRTIQVDPGSHRITFIHPQHGRKNLRVQLPEGASKNVSVRF